MITHVAIHTFAIIVGVSSISSGRLLSTEITVRHRQRCVGEILYTFGPDQPFSLEKDFDVQTSLSRRPYPSVIGAF